MILKPVIPRRQANLDIQEAIDRYLDEAGEKVALGFVGQLQRAYKHIAAHPASGSSRYAHELDLPGLRFWPMRRYPHLVFYLDCESHIDIWRVLHGERDIPGWMREPDV